MSTQAYDTGSVCLLGEVARLITDEVKDSIDRMIALANGELAPVLVNNAERPTPNADALPLNTQDPIVNTDVPSVLPNAERPTLNARIYLRPPHQSSIEYIINRALGVPGADIDYYETTESASEKLQSAKDRETGADYSNLLTNSEKQFVEALPNAIARLMELAAGITVQRMRAGKQYTITRKPNNRAIQFIADRVAGKSGSILDALQQRFQNPDTEREYTPENIADLSDAEKAVLREALEKKQALEAPQETRSNQHSQTSYRHPSTKVARGAGGEGYAAGGEGCKPYNLPAFAIAANKTLKNFLPTAINHMKTLARGAQTIIETETERKVFNHEPDARANTFLINRFMGAPTAYLQIERIVDKTEHQKTMERLTAKYPEVVARYGSIQAALTAHAARTK